MSNLKGKLTPVGTLNGQLSVGGGGTSDYNELENKPSINNVELSGDKTASDLGFAPVATSGDYNDLENKPTIPTKTSELDNDSGFANSSIVANPYDATSTYAVCAYVTHENNLYKCNTAISTAEEWNAEHWTLVDVISAIPTKTSELQNDSGFITGDNYYDKSEIDTALSGKADKSDTYTKSQVDTALSGKANKSDVYTKAQTDSAIVGLIDDTTTANNKAWSSSKITDEIINILPTGTASGSVASFNTSLALPLVSAKFAVNASQESGTPTPSTPKAITGVSAVNVTANGDTTVINLGGTCYGGEIVKDSNGTKFKITHNIIKFNELSWNSSNWGSYPQFYATLSDAKSNTVSSNLGGLICEIYSEVTPSYMYSNPDTAICLNNKTVRVRDSSFATKAEWEQATENYRIIYPIETPTEISLTDIGDIITVIGANSISCDSGNTEVIYKKSIDDAIAELQALILH